MSRRPSRRALPPDRFGEAADDEDLFQALTSSSSEDEGDDGGAGGGAAARRRVTTTTVDESDDDAGGSDAGGDSENIRGAASTESSDRPNSDSECDGTRDLVPLCERETGKRGEAAEQARPGNDAVVTTKTSQSPKEAFPCSRKSKRKPMLFPSLTLDPLNRNQQQKTSRRGNLGPEPALLPLSAPRGHQAGAQRTQGTEKRRRRESGE